MSAINHVTRFENGRIAVTGYGENFGLFGKNSMQKISSEHLQHCGVGKGRMTKEAAQRRQSAQEFLSRKRAENAIELGKRMKALSRHAREIN